MFLTTAQAKGRGLIDRQLYLPAAWIDDRERCRAASIQDEVEFATKPQIAKTLPAWALDGGVPVGWITADEAYGQRN